MKAQLATFETAIGVTVFLAVATYVWSNAFTLANNTISNEAALRKDMIAYDLFNFLRQNATAHVCITEMNEDCVNRLMAYFGKIYSSNFSAILNGSFSGGTCGLADGKVVCLRGA